jgi:hypothetical protein
VSKGETSKGRDSVWLRDSLDSELQLPEQSTDSKVSESRSFGPLSSDSNTKMPVGCYHHYRWNEAVKSRNEVSDTPETG